MKIPFGKYMGINLPLLKPNCIKKFLLNLQTLMDKAIYGHDDAKKQIIQIMGQEIKNPKAKGNMIGLWGPPGNGKCFAKNTPILMYNGQIINVQDIKIGDKLMGDDSKPRTVLSLGKGCNMLYDIYTKIGDKYTVNGDHILCLKMNELNIILYEKEYNTVEFYAKQKDLAQKSPIFIVQYFDINLYKLCYTQFNSESDAHYYLDNIISTTDNILEITVEDYLRLPKFIK